MADKYFRIPRPTFIKGMVPGDKPGDQPKLGMVEYAYASFVQEFMLTDPLWRKRKPEDFKAVVEALVDPGPGQVGKLDGEIADIICNLVMAIDFSRRDPTLVVALMPFMHASTMPRDKAPKDRSILVTPKAATEETDDEDEEPAAPAAALPS